MKAINEIIEYCGIVVMVGVIWQLLELLILGEVRPDRVDTIIGALFSLSIFENLKHCKKI